MMDTDTIERVWSEYRAEEERQGGLARANADEVAEVVAYRLDMTAAQVKSAVMDKMTENYGA